MSITEEGNCFLTKSSLHMKMTGYFFYHQWLQTCHFAEEMFLTFFLSRSEAESMLLRQGHVPLERYLILAGHLKVMSNNTSMNKNTNPEIWSEFKEGDFIPVNIVFISQSLIFYLKHFLNYMCNCVKIIQYAVTLSSSIEYLFQ